MNRSVNSDNRYKTKLNMLWPGVEMCKISGVLLLDGVLLWLLHWRDVACAAFSLAGAVFAALLVLVAIELHQDRVLNELALRENLEGEKHGEY